MTATRSFFHKIIYPVRWNQPWIDENLYYYSVWKFCAFKLGNMYVGDIIGNMYVVYVHNRGPCCHRQKSPTWECVIDASVGKRTRQPQIRRNARAAQWQCWNSHKLQIQRMPSFSPGNLRHMCILHLYQENHFHIFSSRNTKDLW